MAYALPWCGRYTVGEMGFPRSAVIVLSALILNGCREKSCIDGNCQLPCAAISLTCAEQPVFFVGDAGSAPPNLQLREGNAGSRDTLISNGRVTAVISAIDAPNDLAPTGGNLIDFGLAGGKDDVTLTYQIAGILPDDAFAYTSLERGPQSVTLRGTLDGRPEVKVVTHYEIRACDPGIRVHTELFNGSADTQAFFVADAMHWGKRRQVPFAPAKGQGYVQPKLDLLELSAQWQAYDFGAAATPATDRPSYGEVACDREQLSGVNDLEISALGTPMTYVEPGDSIVLERMLVVGDSGGVAPAVDSVLEARTQLFGGTLQTVSGRITGVRGGDPRRASIVISVDGKPITSVVPRDDGSYSARVPAGDVKLEAWSFARECRRDVLRLRHVHALGLGIRLIDRVHDLARCDVLDARVPVARTVEREGAARRRLARFALWRLGRVVHIGGCERHASLRVERGKGVIRDVRANLAHEPDVEVEVMRREQLPAERLGALDEVMQVRSRVRRARLAAARRIEGFVGERVDTAP